MRSILLGAVLSLGLIAGSPTLALAAGDDEEKQAAITELLTVTNELDNGMAAASQLMGLMAKSVKTYNPGADEKVLELVHGTVLLSFQEHADEFRGLTVKVYSDNFTLEEIRELLAFYRSPIGAKVIERQPVIMKQSMTLGAELGERVTRVAVARLVAALEQARLNVPKELRM